MPTSSTNNRISLQQQPHKSTLNQTHPKHLIFNRPSFSAAQLISTTLSSIPNPPVSASMTSSPTRNHTTGSSENFKSVNTVKSKPLFLSTRPSTPHDCEYSMHLSELMDNVETSIENHSLLGSPQTRLNSRLLDNSSTTTSLPKSPCSTYIPDINQIKSGTISISSRVSTCSILDECSSDNSGSMVNDIEEDDIHCDSTDDDELDELYHDRGHFDDENKTASTCSHTVLNDTDLGKRNRLSTSSLDQNVESPIRQSLFTNGDSVLHFPQPGKKVGLLPKHLQSALRWKIIKGSPRVICNALQSAHFNLVCTGNNWIGYWGKYIAPEKYKEVKPWQKINHYPMSFEVGRKDRMYMNNIAMRAQFGDEGLDFTPETFVLPRSRLLLKQAFSKYPLWIIKPPASARGIGIRVISKWSELPKKRNILCSQYISNPFLIYQRKFDLRLYVVITSFDPLCIYLYKDGLVRFASETYQHSTSTKNIRNRFIHLTNYSINKTRVPMDSTSKSTFSAQDPNSTSSNDPYADKFCLNDNKWTLGTFKEYMRLHGHDFEPVMKKIKSLFIKTIMSSHRQNTSGVRLYVTNRKSCFEMFGFDVLLDAELRPWLMEVNISPSMKASCEIDFDLKSKLAVDLFNLVGVQVYDLEMGKAAQTSKNSPLWKKPLLSTLEKRKQREAMLNKSLDLLKELSPDDIRILKETEDENSRKGGFERLYPSPEFINHHKFFISYNYYDRLLCQWIEKRPNDADRIAYLLKISDSCSTSFFDKYSTPSTPKLVSTDRLKQRPNCITSGSQAIKVHTPSTMSPRDSVLKRKGVLVGNTIEKVRQDVDLAKSSLNCTNRDTSLDDDYVHLRSRHSFFQANPNFIERIARARRTDPNAIGELLASVSGLSSLSLSSDNISCADISTSVSESATTSKPRIPGNYSASPPEERQSVRFPRSLKQKPASLTKNVLLYHSKDARYMSADHVYPEKAPYARVENPRDNLNLLLTSKVIYSNRPTYSPKTNSTRVKLALGSNQKVAKYQFKT
ncbi:hypothetical protein BASA62_004438 [Batrachochytrium salamandrivorans]|nr:hypothetical protein BASA62_004438 [Batrachochytrium salamandrivorans]